MKYPIRYPDGRMFGPYSAQELYEYSAQGAFPPNTEIEANGEWVSLGGWLVVRKRVEEIQAQEASRPRASPPPVESPEPPEAPQTREPKLSRNMALAIGAGIFFVVVALALFVR